VRREVLECDPAEISPVEGTIGVIIGDHFASQARPPQAATAIGIEHAFVPFGEIVCHLKYSSNSRDGKKAIFGSSFRPTIDSL
jgi:hypothetical protein